MTKKQGCLIFVCSICNELAVINDSTWGSNTSIPSAQTNDISWNLPTEYENFTRLEEWDHYDDFKKFVELTKDPNVPNFPLCDHCAEIATSHAQRVSDLINKYLENVNTLAKNGEAFNLQVLSHPTIYTPFTIAEKKKVESYESVQMPDIPVPKEEAPMPTRKITGRFAQLSAFRFSIRGPFASINGLRLGSYRAFPVTPQEVHMALYTLCRFLQYQMKITGMDSNCIKLGAGIQFVDGRGNLVDMKFPEHTKEVDKFNLGLIQMMTCFDNLFKSKAMANTRPSNLIDLKKKEITNESFIYNKQAPEPFTRAMRKLVVNLKTIQSYQTFFAVDQPH